MTVDPSVVPGLLFLLAELVALAGVGYVIVRAALRETDDRVALAQGLVVGPAIWGVVVNLVMYALPGRAGAIVGWIFVLALAAVLVWRAPKPVRPRLRTAAGFAIAALALFWIALASRQLLTIMDKRIHLGLSASIRAGLFPPELPWNPGTPAPYHYGIDILNGLLAPPSGPDLAFVQELLGAYAWMSLVLVVGTALLRRGGWFGVLILTPLLLTTGAWTFFRALELIQIPIPAGVPGAGIRASLTEIYWPSVQWPLASNNDAALPNIWKPSFPLAYILAFVVLGRAASSERRTWSVVLTLAALTGFLGLTSSTLTPIVLFLWAGLEAVHLVKCRRTGTPLRGVLVRSACGLALAGLLTLAGGFSTLILGESTSSGLSLGWIDNVQDWRPLGAFERLPGGVALLGLGPLAVAGVAALLARRDRFVLALIVGTLMLMVAILVLRYDPAPWDLKRLAGHARNFALFALVVALGIRLNGLRPARWRYAAAAAVVALVTWPTVIAPTRNLGLAIGNGVELANARRMQTASDTNFESRFVLEHVPSERVAAYIRNHTAVDARMFSPRPNEMTYATGRPNASGFNGLVHLIQESGPAYRDVLRFLEPAAVRRLGFDYIHAPDSWVESLPEEAVQQLNDSSLFELLVRDESESLYRVLPAFLSLDTPPAPGSYEALRQAVSSSATVFLPNVFQSNRTIRTAWALSHAQLFGVMRQELHLRTQWQIAPLGDLMPDLVITPARLVPWMFPPASRQPVWWNDETAVYAPDGALDPIMPPPPWAEPFPFSVRVSDVRAADGRIAFTTTFDDRASDQWSGQDWVVVAIEAGPWDLPKQTRSDGRITATAMWFSGQIWPGSGATSIAYELDLLAPSMAFRDSGGAWTPAGASESESGPGAYVLAVRLRHEYKPNQWRPVAYIPVLKITVSETGDVLYQVY